MDGKLLVFCDEDVTLDEYGNRINNDFNKDIISCLELDLHTETENTLNRDIFFVNWNTFIPNSLDFLNSARTIGSIGTDDKTQADLIFEGMKRKSLMEKSCLDSMGKGLRIDFSLVAMNDFLNRFTDLLEKNRIVQVLPCYSKNQDKSVILNRRKILQTWNDRNQTFLNANCPTITKGIDAKILDGIGYEEFSEVYIKAKDQMMKILSMPYFTENSEVQDVEDK